MEVAIILKSSEKITSTLSIASSKDLNLAVDLDAVLWINDSDITLINDRDIANVPFQNRLHATVLSLNQNEMNAQAILLLADGETLSMSISDQDIWEINTTSVLKNLGHF